MDDEQRMNLGANALDRIQECLDGFLAEFIADNHDDLKDMAAALELDHPIDNEFQAACVLFAVLDAYILAHRGAKAMPTKAIRVNDLTHVADNLSLFTFYLSVVEKASEDLERKKVAVQAYLAFIQKAVNALATPPGSSIH